MNMNLKWRQLHSWFSSHIGSQLPAVPWPKQMVKSLCHLPGKFIFVFDIDNDFDIEFDIDFELILILNW